MKKLMIPAVMAAVLISSVPIYADGGIKVVVDGNKIAFDQPPVIEEDRVLVPLRAVFEALDSNVDYITVMYSFYVNADNTITVIDIAE